MKVLNIDYNYYLYPDKYSELDSFMEYINQNNNKFVPLMQLLEDNCVEPYFIDTDIAKCYINFTTVEKVRESDVTILCKKEYENRLSECISKFCIDCANYKDDKEGDNLKGHRNKMRLDGQCDYKCANEGEE
jgi:hypothetical protein